MSQLVVVQGPDAGRSFELARVNVIGSGERCSLRLADRELPAEAVRIARKGSAFLFQDLSSLGSLSVNRKAARQGRLKNGDLLKIGQSVLMFHDDESPEPVDAGGQDEPLGAARARRRYSDQSGPMVALAADPKEGAGILANLLRIGESLRTLDDLPSTLQTILEITMKTIPADRGAVILFDEESGQFSVAAKRLREKKAGSDSRGSVSRGVLNEIFRKKEALLIEDVREDGRFDARRSVASQDIRSVLGVPLLVGERFLGAVVLDSTDRPGVFSETDLIVLSAIGFQAALAVENARLAEAMREKAALDRELELASEIQSRLLAESLPHRDDLQVYGTTLPAHGVSGDYYDFIEAGEDLYVAIGDVSGKGINAGLVMMMARSFLLPLAKKGKPTREIIMELNEHLLRDTVPGVFMTFLLLKWSRGDSALRFTGAGHEHILLLGSGRVREIKAGGVPLGVSAKSRNLFVDGVVPFSPGSLVLLYSDGATEAMNRDHRQFGLDGLKKSFLLHAGDSLDVMARAVLRDVKDFCGSGARQDDITLVALQR